MLAPLTNILEQNMFNKHDDKNKEKSKKYPEIPSQN